MIRNHSSSLWILVLLLTLVPPSALADDVETAQMVCTVFDSMGASLTCAVSAADNAVDLTLESSDVDPATTCTGFGSSMVHLAQMFSTKWNLRIFTPDSGNEPAAVCDLG